MESIHKDHRRDEYSFICVTPAKSGLADVPGNEADEESTVVEEEFRQVTI